MNDPQYVHDPEARSTKIRPWHLQRWAVVYVRQSSPQQVAEHRESTARQYALTERTFTLGWSRAQIEVIDHHCFLPLYVFCGDELLVAYLRPSNIDASQHTRAVLKLLVRRLRAAWPNVKITIRADSGFCRWRLMRWCDSHGIGYVLGLAKNAVLERLARAEIERAERQFRRTGQPQRVFGSFSYAAGSWDRRRRVIVKAEHTAQGQNPPFVVANVPGDPQELYEDVYCQRGEAENRIKEQ